MTTPLTTSGEDLSPAKQRLLELRLRGQAPARATTLPDARPRPARIPLSFAQQRLWFVDRLQGGSPEYNVADAWRLRGPLDLDALERALSTVVERHEILRTHFEDRSGEPAQVIDPLAPIRVPVDDLGGLEPDARLELLRQSIGREQDAPFDLSTGPLLRVRLLRLAFDDHVLLWTLHHIACDGWSLGVWNRELAALYAAYREGRENPLPPLTLQYADVALWERNQEDQGAQGDAMQYWRRQLAGAPVQLELPADRARPAAQTFEADVHRLHLTETQTDALKRLGREHDATLFMVLLAALGVLLSKYSGQDDVLVGTPIAHRRDPRLESLIGLFVNTLVMRVRVQPRQSFAALLAEVRRTAFDAFQYADVPFERLVAETGSSRSLGAAPLVQVSFAMQNAEWTPPALAGLQIEPCREDTRRQRLDLEVYAAEQNGRIGSPASTAARCSTDRASSA